MDNAPENVRAMVRAQVIEPLIAVLDGRLATQRIEHRLTRPVALRLAIASRKTQGPTVIRTVMVQALPGSLEVTVTVMVDGRGHGLALRVELRDGHPTVVRIEAPSLL